MGDIFFDQAPTSPNFPNPENDRGRVREARAIHFMRGLEEATEETEFCTKPPLTLFAPVTPSDTRNFTEHGKLECWNDGIMKKLKHIPLYIQYSNIPLFPCSIPPIIQPSSLRADTRHLKPVTDH